MIACSVQNIAKMFGGNSLFTNLSFQIAEGERIGLIGQNGSGKTSIFKLLTEIESPDSGGIHFKKGIQVGYLAQIPVFSDEMTSKEVLLTAFQELMEIENKMKELENKMRSSLEEKQLEPLLLTYGGLQEQYTNGGGYEIEANLMKIADGLGIIQLLSKPFSLLSGGEKTKVGLGRMLLQRPDLLLLDEPTNHLDIASIEWLGQFLKEYAGAIIVISHDRYFLDEVVTKIFDLEDGEITIYHGSYSQFVVEKEKRLLQEFQAYEEQQKKIKKMKEAIKRLREWANQANPPSEGLHKRARNMERALERMEKVKRPIMEQKKMKLHLESTSRSGKDVLVGEEISKAFNGKSLFARLNIHIQWGEHVAIVGGNGTGKSTLLKLLLQEIDADTGTVKIGSNVKVGYLSQHYHISNQNQTLMEAFREEVAVSEGEARNILANFVFFGHSVYKKVSQLSGGERMRLRLAQLMYQDINLLVLDEPTNHLDIESCEVLEEALGNFTGTILAVSHDRYFLNKLFEKTYWLEDGSLQLFIGNYDWAKEKMNLNKLETENNSVQKREVAASVKNRERETSPNIEQIEHDLLAIEESINQLERKMMNEQNAEILQQLYEEKQGCKKQYHMLYEAWERLLEQ